LASLPILKASPIYAQSEHFSRAANQALVTGE
jgi:hypothetical protein